MDQPERRGPHRHLMQPERVCRSPREHRQQYLQPLDRVGQRQHRIVHIYASGHGTYYYYCTIHGYAAMHGRITVTAQPSSPTPTPAPRGTPSSPATGGAPGPIGGIALAFGVAVLALAAILRRR
jgi:hypothetical protein